MWIAGSQMGEIDRNALDANTMGDAALAREVLGLFAGECGVLLRRIADPAAGATDRADAAHTLKGAAAGIGALRVQALAGAAERSLRSGAPEAAAGIDALEEAVGAALAEIASAP
jgi:HPt (histidine-containing phosphotransfer) domain-containing protein